MYIINIYLFIPLLLLIVFKTLYKNILSNRKYQSPILFSSTTSKHIMYFRWKNGISIVVKSQSYVDYQQKCLQLKGIINANTKKKIIHRGYPGGLGHKYISVMNSVLYAIFLNYKLISVIAYYIFLTIS